MLHPDPDPAAPPSPRILWILDRTLAALLTALLAAILFRTLYFIPESDNTIAYSLPAANLVETGRLRLPQLGSQFGLDRFWLLNSPLMAAGQVPFFLAFGTRRMADLGGVALLTALNLWIFIAVVRRAFAFRFLSPAVFLTAAVTTNALYLSELSNQRYCVIGYGLLSLAFLPVAGRRARPFWQWLIVGSLPLVHPGLLPAWAVWIAWECGRWIRSRLVDRKGRGVGFAWAGMAAVVATAALSTAWYGRLEMLRAQFLPHLRFGNFRGARRFLGLLDVPRSFFFAIPTWATNIAFVVLAVGIVGLIVVKPAARRRVGSVVLPACLIAIVTALDGLRGFAYLNYYALGAGVDLLFIFRRRGWLRTLAIVAMGGLASTSLFAAVWLSRSAPRLHDTPATLDFIVEHTRPGDRIVLGPPFILASALRSLPEGRQIPRVVPSPYFLDDFDEAVLRDDAARSTDVYVGEERWYFKQVGFHVAPTGRRPIFPDARIDRFEFDGIPVIVARRNGPPPP